MAKKKAQTDEKEPTFEQAYERLTEIAAELEGGETSLDESIERYEEGMKLIARCQRILEAAEAKIELLAKKADGTLEGEPFDRAEATLGTESGLPDAPQSVQGERGDEKDDELF